MRWFFAGLLGLAFLFGCGEKAESPPSLSPSAQVDTSDQKHSAAGAQTDSVQRGAVSFGGNEPPGGRIYFWRMEGTGSPEDIRQTWYSIAPDGTDIRDLRIAPDDPMADTKTPGLPSPDGSWHVYFEGRGRLGTEGRLYVSRLDGSNATPVGEISISDALPVCSVPAFVAWSPDSSKLAYYSGGNGVTVLRTGTWDVIDQFEARSASWSADGAHLVSALDPPAVVGQPVTADSCLVGVRNIETRETNVITQGRAPQWSPDGATIAFKHRCGLHLMAPDGTDIRRVAGYGGSSPGADIDAARCPSGGDWSPDGHSIVVAIDGHLSSIAVASGEQQLLGRAGWGLRWSPDGKWIAYTSDEGSPTGALRGVYLVPADGSLKRQFLAEGELYDWH